MAKWFENDASDPTGRRGWMHFTGEDAVEEQKKLYEHDKIMFEYDRKMFTLNCLPSESLLLQFMQYFTIAMVGVMLVIMIIQDLW